MKRVIFIAIAVCFSLQTVKSQSIKEDVSCLKISNYLWYSSVLLKELREKQTVEKKDEVLPTIEKLTKCARTEKDILAKKFPNDPFLEKIDQWITVEEKNIEGIKGSEWLSKPAWQMGSYLVQMHLEDLIDDGLCKQFD
jgi:hypothetical protein